MIHFRLRNCQNSLRPSRVFLLILKKKIAAQRKIFIFPMCHFGLRSEGEWMQQACRRFTSLSWTGRIPACSWHSLRSCPPAPAGAGWVFRASLGTRWGHRGTSWSWRGIRLASCCCWAPGRRRSVSASGTDILLVWRSHRRGICGFWKDLK